MRKDILNKWYLNKLSFGSYGYNATDSFQLHIGILAYNYYQYSSTITPKIWTKQFDHYYAR